ncbi:hypothetical protein HZF05_12490 [Sphingomonas sp. CGMCC 1.13654]|uniref:Uncharacterized protein n=1 Tax=Sphingomonas chungangi TaxID=2683589 RepID=A0A838L9X1_9SPHN|nr:hypothetical protein [Sphingomonas chungangi]MBA2934916.1 hypothetical protein [Sphingomonas chungangi]MVW58227.1 hypothetical protein [Sphingomonas chungangi]
MSITETVWAVAPLVMVLAALLAFSNRRRRTADYAEARAAKTELSPWVRWTELLSAIVSCLVLGKISFGIFELFIGPSRTSAAQSGASAVYAVIGIGGIVLPLGFLAANFLSWAVPALRRENEKAFRGHRISFTSANTGLIKAAYVSVPVGILALSIAAIEPWAR